MQKKQLQLLTIATLSALSYMAQADDLGINVVLEGEIKPGVYGRVELGNNSHPDLVYTQPRVILVEKEHHYAPVYLHVPPGHAKHWAKHCAEYNACNHPVYFIKSSEYDVENHQGHDNKGKEKHKGNGKH